MGSVIQLNFKMLKIFNPLLSIHVNATGKDAEGCTPN